MLNEKISTVQKLITLGTTIEKHITSRLKNENLTCTEWLVLTFLNESKSEGDIQDLKYSYLLDEMELSQVLETLEQKKLVECKRRIQMIYGARITKLGETLLEDITPEIEKYTDRLLNRMDYTMEDKSLISVFFNSNLDQLLLGMHVK